MCVLCEWDKLPLGLTTCPQDFHLFPPALPSVTCPRHSLTVSWTRVLPCFQVQDVSASLGLLWNSQTCVCPILFFLTSIASSFWKMPGELMLLKQHQSHHQQDKWATQTSSGQWQLATELHRASRLPSVPVSGWERRLSPWLLCGAYLGESYWQFCAGFSCFPKKGNTYVQAHMCVFLLCHGLVG